MKRESKTFIKNMLIKWLGKIDSLFFEKIWKPRNEDMLIWEQNNNITKLQKRKKNLSKSHPRSKREIRNLNKTTYSGKKKSSVHVLDEKLDFETRNIFGLNRGFQWVLDKKIMIYIKISFSEWCVAWYHGDT